MHLIILNPFITTKPYFLFTALDKWNDQTIGKRDQWTKGYNGTKGE